MSGRSIFFLLVLLAAAPFGCQPDEGIRSFCTSDDQCPQGYRCDRSNGLCVCASDEVCPPGYVCSPDGVCRKKIGCDTNQDCPEGTFCDSSSGTCIEVGKCTSDIQCPPGQICTELFRCAPGCRDSGDCPLRQMCDGGKCREGLCEDKTWCGWGQLCDTETNTCYDDTRGPYCAYCRSATLYEPHQCGSGPNFCLVKGGDLSLPPYCGVDCTDPETQPCPNGYDCFSVRIVYTSENCRDDSECDSGVCQIKEGDQLGFCLCTSDSHCPQDSCDDTTMECRITRRPCTPIGNECDRPVYCIEGFCHIGYNCKPLEGLRCEDLLSTGY